MNTERDKNRYGHSHVADCWLLANIHLYFPSFLEILILFRYSSSSTWPGTLQEEVIPSSGDGVT